MLDMCRSHILIISATVLLTTLSPPVSANDPVHVSSLPKLGNIQQQQQQLYNYNILNPSYHQHQEYYSPLRYWQ